MIYARHINMPYVGESLVIEDKEKLIALVYPDQEMVEKESLTTEQLQEKLNEALKMVNTSLPNYCKLAAVEIFPEEFEKTPKKSIKRYLYQRKK